MKTTILLKTITVAGAVAATLTLSACDMHISFGQEGQGQEQSQGQGQEQGQGQGQDQGQDAETSANPDEAAQDPNAADSPAAQEPAPGSDTGSSSSASDSGSSSNDSGSTSASDSNSSSSDSGSSSNSTTENDGYQGPRIGEEGVELDADGYGKIPADVLEKDIKNAYAKQGTTVDVVDCYADLRILAHRGSQSCTVTAAGKKNYGTVKITSATQSGISYSLEFPRI